MFSSNEELFTAVEDLATRFESEGDLSSRDSLYDGLGLINGLTDGWHLFLEKLEEVRNSRSSDTKGSDELDLIISATRKAVYRW